VAEADAEDRDLPRGLLSVRVELRDLVRCDLVVAPDDDLSAQLPEVLDQVVREGVVVVDHEDPHGGQDFSR
jgi:hypothetical protein